MNSHLFSKLFLATLLFVTSGSLHQAMADESVRQIKTIVELKGNPPRSENEVVGVSGFSTPGDGGAGFFHWEPTAIEEEDGGTIFAGNFQTTGRWKRSYSGAVNIKWFGAKGDGITDDSASFINAWKTATRFNQYNPETQASNRVVGTRSSSGLYLPSGTYVITSNYFLNNCGAQPGFKGRAYSIFGDGYGSSILRFKPTAQIAYIYDQTQTNAPTYTGLNFRNLQIYCDPSGSTGGTIQGFKVYGQAGAATQQFIFDTVIFTGQPDTVFLDLQGTDNASESKFINCSFYRLKSLIKINNKEAVNHYVVGTDIELLFGNAFEVQKGGCITMVGGSVIFDRHGAVDECALLKVGKSFEEHSGNSHGAFTFIGVRCEFRAAKSRSLYISDFGQCVPISFINCSFAKVDFKQSFALVAADQSASITYQGCVLPDPASGSKFEFVDGFIQNSFTREGSARSILRFIGCMNAGDIKSSYPYADLTKLGLATGSQSVEYVGCLNIPDSIEYGHKYATGRSTNPIGGKWALFGGYLFPFGDGKKRTEDFFRFTIPYNSFVESFKATRAALATPTASDYELEIVDKKEWGSPGSGTIFGTMPKQKYHLAIDWEIKINRRFSGSLDERTVYLRLKPGTSTGAEAISSDLGLVYAKTF